MTIARSTIAVAAALSALLAASAGAQQAPVRLRLGTLAPQGTSYDRILREMAERWRAVTNGRVQTTIYAGTMGSEAELVRRVRLGQLQVAALTAVGLMTIDPAVGGMQSIPMVFRSVQEEQYVLTRLQPLLERRLLERGFVVLFWGNAGWVRFFTRTPVLRPADLHGPRIFVTAGDNAQFDLMKSEGYSPVLLDWSDALTALRTGMVDAIPVIPLYALTMQFYTVASHMTMVNWAPLLGALVVSRNAWDALPADVQAAMRAAAVEAGGRFTERGRVEEDSAVTAMQRRGLTVHVLTPAQDAEWRALSERLYPRIRGTLVPSDVFDEVIRLVREYRARPGGGQ